MPAPGPDSKTARPAAPAPIWGDGGFSMVEVVMAVLLAAIVGIAFTASLRGALSSTREARFRQDATALAMDRLETARALDWDDIGMSSVIRGSPMISGTGLVLLAQAAGLERDESLVRCTSGGMAPIFQTAVQDVDYVVWTYVSDAGEEVRRVVVLVTWDVEGERGSYRSSALVSSVSQRAGTVTQMWPDAAVVAESAVTLGSNAALLSTPASAHEADLVTNGNASGLSGSVDGDVRAGGAASFDPGRVWGSIEGGLGVVFGGPSDAAVLAWRDAIRAEAQGGTVIVGSTTISDRTVTAPIYVSGTLTLSGSVTISGSGPVYASQGIVVKQWADVATEGAYLVSDGQIYAEYYGLYRTTDPTVGGIVSFQASSTALQLGGGWNGSLQGLGYAPFGGAVLTGSRIWNGAIIAGGKAGLGTVSIGDGATVTYPAGLTPASTLLDAASGGESGSCGG